jgi:hypothetical protein
MRDGTEQALKRLEADDCDVILILCSGAVPPSVIGGAILPHAPQFFTMPETEDRATVARVKEVAHQIGSPLKAR